MVTPRDVVNMSAKIYKYEDEEDVVDIWEGDEVEDR